MKRFASAALSILMLLQPGAIRAEEPIPPLPDAWCRLMRLYNPNSGEHFYTANEWEKNDLVRRGWKDEGDGWNAPVNSEYPVYRLYNPNAGDHHFTLDKQERDVLVRLGWKDEGIGWYSEDTTGIPVYRQYNPNAKSGSHNYTVDKNENDKLVEKGWIAEGIAWWGKWAPSPILPGDLDQTDSAQ